MCIDRENGHISTLRDMTVFLFLLTNLFIYCIYLYIQYINSKGVQYDKIE